MVKMFPGWSPSSCLAFPSAANLRTQLFVWSPFQLIRVLIDRSFTRNKTVLRYRLRLDWHGRYGRGSVLP
jgi:hypothetical protein